MVARKTVNKGKKATKQQKPKRVPRLMPSGGVEKAVRDYIALLKDPCNGPLIGPVGATANGYITRFETTVIVNTNHPNWVLKWCPGLLNTVAANNIGLNGVESSTMTGAMSAVLTNDEAPGFNFLSNTCTTFRCLAACAQIRYTDTEVNRRGVIGSTICSGSRDWGNVQEAFSVTVDRARVPDQSMEVLWQPGDGDELFSPVTSTFPDNDTLARKNGIFLAGSGCLAASVSIRLVVVYQWTPQSNDSMVLPVPTPGTGLTMARVVQLARQTGFVAGHLLKGYATGGLYGVAREAASMIRPSVRLMAN